MSQRIYHIAVVDDSPDNREILKLRLSKKGYHVIPFPSGEAFLGHVKAGEHVDLVLLDLMMPGMSGFDVIEKLREEGKTRHLPIIVVSAAGETEAVVNALRKGANDYVTKPVNFDILLARIETQLRMREALETIRAQRDMMEALALLDPLTGVYNRRALEARLEDEFHRCVRYGRHLSLIFFDLDNFKSVNDTYGHLVGDCVLRWFATQAQELVRTFDVVGRYGGEEFCVILGEASGMQAFAVAERIREAVATETVDAGSVQLSITVSGGVAEATPDLDSPQTLIRMADMAMYHAKRQGRNRIVLYSPDCFSLAMEQQSSSINGKERNG